ncbi:MAG: RidA family protein [Solirubrobacterales bacterium]
MADATHIRTINPEQLGPAVAPYSQATVAGNLIFVAGQIGFDNDNNVIAPGEVGPQTTAAIERIEVILAEAGASLDDVVTTTVYLTNPGDFAAFNEAWSAKFGDHRPARATVLAGLLLDGLVVEIMATAVRPD